MPSFNTFIEERAADRIDVTDDDGKVIASVPRPQFWTAAAQARAAAGEGPEFWHEVIGVEAFERVLAAAPDYEPKIVADLLMDYVMTEVGIDLGKLSASSQS